ncbi:MAG TPA: glycoside hydrolase family 38 C-terminal domain-containing protein [Stellaceae bacterium]|nr:glycoside hydrolase family 38 C-terminal domain-containing protein [Stellaceae bacterium]
MASRSRAKTPAEFEAAIRAAIHVPLAELEVTAWVTQEPVPFAARETGRRIDLRPGQRWSDEPFDCAWFRFRGTVPQSAAGREIVLLIDVNGEACVVDDAGNPVLGLTNGSSVFTRELGDPAKRVVPILAAARGGEPVELWADAGANDLFGKRQENGTLALAAIAARNPALAALAHDFAVLNDLLPLLPAEGARAGEIRAALADACGVLNNFTETEAEQARALLAPALQKRGGGNLAVSAVGHAHIDLAWLWPIRETMRKTARTFATALALMERYPDYVFGASQPQQYDWIKRQHPALYGRIKARVAEGRWEPQGAMWVESDLNLAGGEALVRQIVYGTRFFREEFGASPTCLWEPDVFGCSGAVPQLLVKSGVEFFMTQKLSWNWVTRFPHHTFWWEGIDGSRVLAHFPPEDTYNSSAAPRAVYKAATNFAERAVSDRVLLLFGIGDGGGGPSEDHLEFLARERDLDGLAPVVQERSDAFFRQIRNDAARYPVWRGELYLERHQGTYTTQGRSKRMNRALELALRELEFAAAIAAALTGHAYPRARLEEIWKEVLLYQFHDILPGSSIARVYDESLVRYEALAAEVAALTAAVDASLLAAIGAGDAARPAAVLNSLSWPRREWLRLGAGWGRARAPAMGYAIIDAAAAESCEALMVAPDLLENDLLRLEFAADGSLVRIYDKENEREVLAPSAVGNVLAVYADSGDAWDIPMDYRERAPERFVLESAEPVVDGPRGILRTRYRYQDSTLEQDVVLCAESRRVDFVTRVDWRERGRMLRTSFPVAVAAREATCGIQFGSIRRPTHADTPADRAKFEICAQKWVDISAATYGVALLDNCKYGHRVQDNILDLNLLRSPQAPDPTADRAAHLFTYALYPHAGDHVAGGVVRAAYELNMPLRVLGPPHGAGLPPRASWFELSVENIVIETVKEAEDGQGIVLRLYEAAGRATAAELRCGFELAAAALTNLMEEGEEALPLAGNAVRLDFRPYEIHTLRLRIDRAKG